MTEAYVLVNCSLGKEEHILDHLRDIHSISLANGVFGAYDIIAKIETNNPEDLKDILTNKIRKLEFVRSTLVLMVIDEQNQ
jgi:DNA-binding Lrp family transcriptional regulator